jgi:hypothetical protein
VLALLVVPVGHTSQGHDEQHQAFKEAKKKEAWLQRSMVCRSGAAW